MNLEKLRLSAASHSDLLRLPAELGLLLVLAAAAEDQSGSRPKPSGEEEADAEGADGDRGQVGAYLCADVRRLSDLLTQVFCCAGELLALGLDVTPDLLERAGVATCH
jgi:hypothetical protein